MNAALFNFDCTGFYHMKQVIPLDAINEINDLYEKDNIKHKSNIKRQITLNRVHAETLLHPSVLEVCKVCFRESYHLNHLVVVQQDSLSEKAQLSLHGRNYGKSQAHYYISHLQEHIKTPCLTSVGQLSVGIALKPQTQESGGFCYVPGSHKTSYNISGHELVHSLYKDYKNYKDTLVIPNINPGDLVAFPESLIHGHTAMKSGYVRRIMYGMFFPASITFKSNDAEASIIKSLLPEELKKYIINDISVDQLSKQLNTIPLIRPDYEWK